MAILLLTFIMLMLKEKMFDPWNKKKNLIFNNVFPRGL